MCLLPGDISAILQMRDAVLEEDKVDGDPRLARKATNSDDTETPPRLPSDASPGAATPPPQPQPFNPFARKRTAPADTAHMLDATVLPKRPRVVGDGASNFASKSGGVQGPSVRALKPRETVQHNMAEQRMAKPELRRRGGYGAADAARCVLAQRGIFELEGSMDESKDRGKLASYFKQDRPKATSAAVAAGGGEVAGTLRHRPDTGHVSYAAPARKVGRPPTHEDDAEGKYVQPVAENVLSLKSARGANSSCFRARGSWGTS